MTSRRACMTGIALVVAAGAAGTMVAAQSSPPDDSDQHIAGWTIGDAENSGLSMSHRVGFNQIQYTADTTGHPPSFIMETHPIGENCIIGDDLVVGGSAIAERARQIRAEMERRMVSIRTRCALAPAENAALIDGFDAAYAVYAARYERLQAEAVRDRAEHAIVEREMEAEMNISTEATPRPHH